MHKLVIAVHKAQAVIQGLEYNIEESDDLYEAEEYRRQLTEAEDDLDMAHYNMRKAKLTMH